MKYQRLQLTASGRRVTAYSQGKVIMRRRNRQSALTNNEITMIISAAIINITVIYHRFSLKEVNYGYFGALHLIRGRK